MTPRALTLLVCLAAVLAGCRDELPLPASTAPPKITLTGELIEGEQFSIRAGQSIGIGGNRIPIIQGLTISVKDGDGGQWVIPGVEDSLSDELRTVSVSSGNLIHGGGQYTLTAQHPVLGEASAVVQVPQPFTVALVDTVRGNPVVGPALRATISINDAPGDHYYVIEAVKQPMNVKHEFLFGGQWRNVTTDRILYDSLRSVGAPFAERRDTTLSGRFIRIPLFTVDPATENVGSAPAAATLYRRVLLTDKKFQGGHYTTEVSVISQEFVSLLEEKKGRVLLQVKSVSKDYFDFLKRYEVYQSDVPTEPGALKGNVVGGYGMVGGASKVQWAWIFDTWE